MDKITFDYNFVQSSTTEYGGTYGSSYTSMTNETIPLFKRTKTPYTVKKWETTPHKYAGQFYKCK